MEPRKVYLVGSLPPEITNRGETHAMEWVLHEMALANEKENDVAELMAMVCDRDDRWIIQYMDEVTQRKDAFEVVRGGVSADYDDMPIVKPRRKLTKDDVSMHRILDIVSTINAHRQLGLHGKVKLQLSFPNRLDLALFLFVGRLQTGKWFGLPTLKHPWRTLRGIWYTLRYLGTFKKAQQQEIAEIQAIDTDNVIVFNFESPAVLYALNLVPKFFRRPVAWLLAKQCAGVLKDLPIAGTVCHLCYGNLDDTEVIQPGTVKEAVMFLLALGRQTTHRPVTHIPCAYGDHAAPTDPEYYAWLSRLTNDWRVIAGVVDEHHHKASAEALSAFESALGRRAYGVATACGLGRHSDSEAQAAVRMASTLAQQAD